MAGDKHILPRLMAGKKYLISGKLFNGVMETLERWRPLPGTGMRAEVTPSGTLLIADKAAIHRNPFECFVTGAGRNRVGFAPGRVLYVETVQRLIDDDPRPGIVRRPVTPTLDGVPLDAADPSSFDVTGMTGFTGWLVCQQDHCISVAPEDELVDPERIVITNRNVDPPLADGEFATPLIHADLAPAGNGALRLDNVQIERESDLEMFYTCNNDQDSGNDSDWGSETGPDGDSTDSGYPIPPDSGSDDPQPESSCLLSMSVRWLNLVPCFPAKPILSPLDKCVPKPFTFELEIRLKQKDSYLHPCPAWAWGVTAEGAEPQEDGKDEVQWVTEGHETVRVVRFHYKVPPACGYIVLHARAKGYPRPHPAEDEISCCGTRPIDLVPFFRSKKLPSVCGCYCSSPGDVDGDGVPNEHDPDYDNDHDGIPNRDDPDWAG